jgi:hypothetical protein
MFSVDPHSGQVEGQLRQACAELSRRLRSGQECRAEEVASSFPSVASDPHHLLELVLTELETRRALGQSLRPEDWYARYPQWRERLWLWFAVENEVTEDRSPNTMATVAQNPLPASAEAVPQKALGRYQLLGELGRGGMGIVYRARDTILGRVVALKRIRAGVLAGAEAVERFYREARAAAQLKHPNIISLYDIDQQEDEHYLTMEFATGGSLTDSMPRFQKDPRQAVALVEKLARGIHHAHSKGILHRDLKPGNILLDENDAPRISDFGLAKFLDGDAELTRSGVVVGTPAYMAPEQASGRPGGACVQSDLWALGVILYELLTGRRPFVGGSQQVTDQILLTDPPRPRAVRPGLDRDLERVVLKCLEKEPAWRYPSAEALADDLARWLRGEPVTARRAPWPRRAWRALLRRTSGTSLVALLLLVGLGGVGGILALVSGPANEPTAEEQWREEQARKQRVLAALTNDLAAGKQVTLVDKAGLPKWYRWMVGSNKATVAQDRRGGELEVATYHFAFMELLPDPQQRRYRFSAEVRMDETIAGEVGLYFLGEERRTAHGPEQYCCALTFADKGPLAGRVILKLFRYWEVNGQFKESQEHYVREMPLSPERVLRLPHALAAQALGMPVGVVPTYPQAFTSMGVAVLGASRQRWRHLVIDVTPEGIAASLDGCPMGTLDQTQLRQESEAWWRMQSARRPPWMPPSTMPAGNPPPLLAARGSMGLLLRMVSASFRNVTVSPLPRVTPH